MVCRDTHTVGSVPPPFCPSPPRHHAMPLARPLRPHALRLELALPLQRRLVELVLVRVERADNAQDLHHLPAHERAAYRQHAQEHAQQLRKVVVGDHYQPG